MAQFSTKNGINIQLLTLTLGPIELWAFSTTAEDVLVRNRLYKQLGPENARLFLASVYPNGSIAKEMAARLNQVKESSSLIDADLKTSVLEEFLADLLRTYAHDPESKHLLLV